MWRFLVVSSDLLQVFVRCCKALLKFDLLGFGA